MKRRSTRTHRDDEEEVVDTSADSDATTTKPTSRALKGLESYNKSGNQEDTTKNASGDSHNYRSDPRKFVLRGKQKGRGGVITNSSRGGVSKSASRSTQSGRGTATTRRNHGSNVEWSPSASSSSLPRFHGPCLTQLKQSTCHRTSSGTRRTVLATRI